MVFINFSKYSHFIFDNDGVLFDTNHVKINNIRTAASEFMSEEKLEEFVKYFAQLSGIPREVKINKYFDDELSLKVINSYNELNKNSLLSTPPTPDVLKLLKVLKKNGIDCHVISGGDLKEVTSQLDKFSLTDYFKNIKTGPLTKEENFKDMKINGNCIFVGDSQVDYEFAKEVDIDFIFMSDYTAFSNWKSFFAKRSEVQIIRNLTEL